jgi:phosphatidylserine/phosphatidylglycerophosphate/cardiolipin synthase-like enzyme
MKYHDNKVIISVNGPTRVVRGTYTVESFSVTDGQDPEHKIHDGLVASFGKDGEMCFQVGRKGSDKVADWFNQRVPASKTTFNHSAGKLNFAFIGTLEITVTGDIFGDSEETFEFFQVAIAQGHAGASNNWWFGGENCSYIQGDQVICNGTNSKGGLVSLTVQRGGNGVNKIDIFPPSMTYRDNEVILSISDNCSMVRGSLKIDSFSVTSGQDPYGQLYSSLLASFISDGKMSFKVGRQGSDKVADWFNQQVPASKTTFNHSAGELNFAFIGTLKITVTGDIFGDGEETFEFSKVAIAQGHAGASNNWWFGGENCSYIQGDQVICNGTNSKGGLVSLTVQRGGNGVNKIEIKSIDTQLASLSVDALHKYLVTRYGKGYDGSAFALTEDNVLRGGWIAQTPNVWGKEASKVESYAGIYIADDIKTLISSAEYFIDITTLSPFPDDKFHEKILEGLKEVAESGKEVTVRILAGWPPSSTFQGVKSYLESFANPISKIANNKLKIYVASQKSSLISWNHAKMVAVDGKAVLLGGQNLWTKDYLETTPVHDLNVLIHGSAAYYSHQFANLLWEDVRKYVNPIWMPWSWESGQGIYDRNYPDAANFSKPIGEGKVYVLGVGRYGTINANIQPSDYLMLLTLNSAKSTIRIAQQDLAFVGGFFWDDGMKAIANAIVKKCDVYIVLSNDGSKGGSNPYSNTSLAKTADKLRSYVKAQSKMTDDELKKLLCEKLHLTTLRFGPSDTWLNGVTFANHSKFFMVDDKVFYVGSSNLYSSDLQEYGVFISDPDAISQMKSEYWDKLWEYSRRVSISGSGDNGCYFMKSDKGEL